jgi:hypothetical protein
VVFSPARAYNAGGRLGDGACVNEPTYTIQASEHRCAACAGEIVPGSEYFSTVTFADAVPDGASAEGKSFSFARRDYCVPCWPAARGPEAAEAAGVFAYWKTWRPQAAAGDRRRVRFDPAVVLEFFRRLGPALGPACAEGTCPALVEAPREKRDEIDAIEPRAGEIRPALVEAPREKRDVRFVLALLLLRKKVLVYEGSAVREGHEWIRFAERGDPAAEHWVENPRLSDSELERVRDAIGELLEMRV